MTFKIPFHKIAFLFVVVSFVATCCSFMEGCASASVQNMYQREKKFYSPTVIYIQPYTFNQKGITVARSDQSLEDLKQLLSKELMRDLQRDLRKIFPDCRVLSGPPPTGPYWLITGKFNQVQQGSRLLRTLIGFGAGKTKLRVTTRVYTLFEEKPKIIYTVNTIASSGGMPGALPSAAASVAVFPLAPAMLVGSTAAGGAYRSSISGLSFDTRRTSHEITAAISDYLYRNGVLSKEKHLQIKHTGRSRN